MMIYKMKRTKTLALTAAFLLSAPHLASLKAQPVATPLVAGQSAEGITYFLPKTVYNISLQIERSTYQPGQFSAYASRYLHIHGVRQEKEVDHQLLRVEVSMTGVRDTSKCYTLHLKGGKGETADVRLSEENVLLAINEEPLPAGQQSARLMEGDWADPEALLNPSPNPMHFLSDDIREAGSTAKMAELTAAQMDDLIERRQQLLLGEADDQPQDDAQLQRLLAAIDEEYDALMTLFTGTIRRDTIWKTISYCPLREVQREVLFRLSRFRGIVDSDDLSGVPYYITIEDLYKTDTAKYPNPDKKKNDGLCVNVPGRIRLTLHRESQQLQTFELPCAQLGFVESRTLSPFKRYVMHLLFHPATGALVKCVADTEVVKESTPAK